MNRIPSIASALLGAAALFSPAAQAQQTQLEFGFTGAAQFFVVPAGVSSIHVDLYGAEGGSARTTGGSGAGGNGFALGGRGGWAFADLAVTPGDKLELRIGGAGGAGLAQYLPFEGAIDFYEGTGGFNGGGLGQAGGSGGVLSLNLYAGGGGGGSTTLLLGTNRLLVAAGGGGGAVIGTARYAGGSGGGLSGLAGQGTGGGAGGNQSSGGAGGLGAGGTGLGGAGGGGGYFGGLGGFNAAGGGGSSFVGGVGVTAGQTFGDFNPGDGRALFTYAVSAVPEPATWLMTLLGAGVLLRRRHRG